jgi:hypothetical protein
MSINVGVPVSAIQLIVCVFPIDKIDRSGRLRAARVLDDLAGLKRGSLTLAVSQTVANYWLLPPNPRKHATLPVNVTVSVPLYGPVPKTLIAQTEDVLVDRRATYNNRQQSGRLDSEIRRKMKPVSKSRSLVSTSR